MRVALLAALAAIVLTASAAAAAEPPSINAAFQAVYPSPDQSVAWEGRTHQVRFAPAAMYELAPHLYALVSRGKNSESCHGCTGFYSVAYVEDAPRLRVLGEPLVSAGGDDGRGLPPRIDIAPQIGAYYTLAAESNFMAQGVGLRWVDLVRLGQRPEVVARGVHIGIEDSGAGGRCKITGVVRPVAREKAFIVDYRGTWKGEVEYRWDGKTWQPADPGFTLESKCPSRKG